MLVKKWFIELCIKIKSKIQKSSNEQSLENFNAAENNLD